MNVLLNVCICALGGQYNIHTWMTTKINKNGATDKVRILMEQMIL